MNKKLVQGIMAMMVICMAAQSVVATSTGNGYNAPVVRSAFDFKAVVQDDGDVAMSWVPYAPAGFNYYKVVRSQVNSNPVYPDDGYIYYGGDPAESGYVDQDPPTGKTYYRVCSIASPNRYCSPVVALNLGSGSVSAETAESGPAVMVLSGKVNEGYVGLTWTVQGSSPYGFKVCKSAVNAKPTYPVIPGDAYRYLTEPAVRSMKDTAVKAGQTYHYRVCQYDGKGACVAYSNAVSVAMRSDGLSAESDKTTETVEESKDQGEEVEEKSVDLVEDAELSDIGSHEYQEGIEYLLNKKIVQGYADGTFKPDAVVNRAEFLKMLLLAKVGEGGIGEGTRCFRDVVTGWFTPYVCYAKQKGIVSGYSDGTFKPSRTISFAEAAKMVAELYGFEAANGASWYEGYVKALQERKSVPPSIGSVDQSVTRGELAELLWRVDANVKGRPSSELIGASVQSESGDYAGWQTFEKNGYTLRYPSGWYRGLKSYGWDMLSEEKDYIDNLNVTNYMDVDTYVATYVAVKSGATESSLATKVWFGHPLVSTKSLTVNGYPALRRHYRAPAGTVVNGRTTGENENIIAYTYLKDGKVVIVQFFNASGNESYGVDQFEKIAKSFE